MSDLRDLRVRTMETRDLGRVLAIEEASFSEPWSRETFRRLLAQETAAAVVAESGEEVAGYAVCWRAGDEAELGNLAVAPGARRRGVARTLVRHVEDRARGDGAAALYLEVRESNRAARSLYRELGFRNVGRRRGYYRSPAEDALVLRRPLDGPGGPEDP